MKPRPILLVRSPLCAGDAGEVKLDGSVEGHLRAEGYIVLHCPAPAMDAFRIVAAHPFTAVDVEALRSSALLVPDRSVYEHALVSIADRMEALL